MVRRMVEHRTGWRKLCVIVAALVMASPAAAQAPGNESGFQAYMQVLAARARAQGVSESTIARVVPQLRFNPRVIELDRTQPGGGPAPGPIPAFAPYRAKHVDGVRITQGRRQYEASAASLGSIERSYGVPGSILLAIWGNESNYGAYTGDFDLFRSLATLAYEGRRRELFAQEFIAALKMVDRGVPRAKMVGSWAGAFGNPQFLPSVYLRVARDGDGDGFADIWSSRADTLASIASYFRDAGWRRGEPWGIAVSVPGGLHRAALASKLASPRCGPVFQRHSRWLSMREWRSLGLQPRSGTWPADGMQATLLEPDGPERTAYLLTGNYRVILDYNCSNFYALSVGLLADAIRN